MKKRKRGGLTVSLLKRFSRNTSRERNAILMLTSTENGTAFMIEGLEIQMMCTCKYVNICIYVCVSLYLITLNIFYRFISSSDDERRVYFFFCEFARERAERAQTSTQMKFSLIFSITIDVAVFEHTSMLTSRAIDFCEYGFSVILGRLRIADFEARHFA